MAVIFLGLIDLTHIRSETKLRGGKCGISGTSHKITNKWQLVGSERRGGDDPSKSVETPPRARAFPGEPRYTLSPQYRHPVGRSMRPC
jgi:hypothetical protein